jgi:hypothetical protein
MLMMVMAGQGFSKQPVPAKTKGAVNPRLSRSMPLVCRLSLIADHQV